LLKENRFRGITVLEVLQQERRWKPQ